MGSEGLWLLDGIDPLDGDPPPGEPLEIGRESDENGVDVGATDPGRAAQGAIEHLHGSHGGTPSKSRAVRN
jgi:hypothetical protein